jgi:hypothetical protein
MGGFLVFISQKIAYGQSDDQKNGGPDKSILNNMPGVNISDSDMRCSKEQRYIDRLSIIP